MPRSRLDATKSSVRRESKGIDQPEVLELSIWHNLSSHWRTPHSVFDNIVHRRADHEHEYYIVGGYERNYDSVTRKIQKLHMYGQQGHWKILPGVTIPPQLGTTHMAVSIYNDRLYIFTGQLEYGCGPATRASAYLNLSSYEWVNLPDVPEERYSPQIAIVNNQVHIFGGSKPDRTSPSPDYWILDLDNLNQGWTNGPSLPESGDHGIAKVIDNWIYTLTFEHGHAPLNPNHTGSWNQKEPIRCPGEYLAQSPMLKVDVNQRSKPGEWIRLADLLYPVSHAGGLVLNNRYLMIIGGIGPIGDRPVNHVQLYDIFSNEWRVLSPLRRKVKSPHVWIDEYESIIYMEVCITSITLCQVEHAHIIWSHKSNTETCLFYEKYKCTTRQLRATSRKDYLSNAEMRWNRLFSNIYLLNLRTAVDRLRTVWNEMYYMALTSITLFEALEIKATNDRPTLIDPNLLWHSKMEGWRKKNDTGSMSHFIHSSISIKLMFMNMWTRNMNQNRYEKPVLIMEDDLEFVLSKEETISTVEKVVHFLIEHSEIEWDIIYLAYRNIHATRTYTVSEDPPIYLWRASQVYSNTAFIVNQNKDSIDRLNNCYQYRLNEADQSLSYCMKYQMVRAYVIQPKLVQAAQGFSYSRQHTVDFDGTRSEAHFLSNHTPPALFKTER